MTDYFILNYIFILFYFKNIILIKSAILTKYENKNDLHFISNLLSKKTYGKKPVFKVTCCTSIYEKISSSNYFKRRINLFTSQCVSLFSFASFCI